MGTEIFKIDAPWAEELTKTRVSFLMNPTVHPRLDEDLLPVLCDPQRLVQSVHVERHLLAAAPQQPLPRLALAVGLEVRGRLSAALPVTETVSFGFGF